MAAAAGKVPKSAVRPQPKGGSRKGKPNRATAALKEMILHALDEVGGVAYLARQAEETPAAFLMLLGKILPMQLAAADGAVMITVISGVPRNPDDPPYVG